MRLCLVLVSRGLGDFEFKNNPRLAPPQQKVSCEPEIRAFARSPADELIVIACDGIWDVLSNEGACQVVRDLLAEVSTGSRDAG